MGKKQQTSTTTNSFGFFTPPNTQDFDAVRAFKIQADPSFGAYASDLKRRNQETRNRLTGPYVTPEQQEQVELAQNEEIAQEEAQARRGLNFDTNRTELSRLMGIAELTRPQLANTGGTTTTTGGGGIGSTILNGVLSVLPFL